MPTLPPSWIGDLEGHQLSPSSKVTPPLCSGHLPMQQTCIDRASPRPFVKTLLQLGGARTGGASDGRLPPSHGDNTPKRASPCGSHAGRTTCGATTTCCLFWHCFHCQEFAFSTWLSRMASANKLCHSCASPRTCELKCNGPLWRSD